MTSQSSGRAVAARPRSSGMRRFLAACMLLAFLGFLALGTWQVKRLFWKLDLIERVDRRVHAQPVAAPGPATWPQVSAASHEYLHVRISGEFLYSKTARVQALTRLGSGFWLMTPLRGADGGIVFVNRGFVTATASDMQKDRADAPATVTGLLRMNEPGGGFLRHNDPASDRWFSRDVQAIAAARGLSTVAPYFIDAEAPSGDPVPEEQRAAAGNPVGGLTVIAFPNNHLVYAFTWYALALMTAGACFWIARDEKRRRGSGAHPIDQESKDGKQH